MVAHLRLARLLWALTAALAFAAALGGVLTPGLYVGLFPEDFLPGALYQDVLTLGVCAALFGLAAVTRPEHIRRQVVALGLLGSLFYLYGIFTIERVYNAYYLLYAAVFALSFWSIAVSLAGFPPRDMPRVQLSRGVLRTTAISSIAIGVVFTVLWTAALLPLMREHDRIDFLYSIYILDLCFVMPAFFITASMSLRGMALGILLAPAIMILGFFVIFPLGLNELAKPSAGLPMAVGPMAMSFAFAFFMLVVGGLHLRAIRLA